MNDVNWKSVFTSETRFGIFFNVSNLENLCQADKENEGVYIIWPQGVNRVAYVGSGHLSELWEHIHDAWVSRYKNLMVNYAVIDDEDETILQRIEKYLDRIYRPTERKIYPEDLQEEEIPLPGFPTPIG